MATIASRINALQGQSVESLRYEYRKVYGEETTATNKVFLLKKIAWRIQEIEFGGVSDETKEKAISIVETLKLPGTIPTSKRPEKPNKSAIKDSRDKRLPPIGAVITKEYKGALIRVEVLEDAFLYDDCKYKSLSAVAKVISESHCNGYLFFGLK